MSLAVTVKSAHTTSADKSTSNNDTVPSTSVHWLCYSRGKRLAKQGHYEAALDSFNLALDIQPHEPQIWIFRGVVLTHLKHYESALASFNKALALTTTNREAWIFRGAVLMYLNRSLEAHSSYAIALELQQQGIQACEDYLMWVPGL